MLDYGAQTLWPDHCIQAATAPNSTLRSICRRPSSSCATVSCEIDSYSAFFENDRRTPTGLASYLRERGFRRVFLTGLALNYCVMYSALDAIGAGFEVVVLADACRAIDLQGSLAWAMGEMRRGDVRIASTDDAG